MYKNYFHKWSDHYGFWHKIINRDEKYLKLYINYLNKIEKKDIDILDLGCGDGKELNKCLRNYPQKRFHIVANDNSNEALKFYHQINSSYIKKLVKGDFTKKYSYFNNQKYDIILFSNSLYAVKIDDFFKKYKKLLKRNGVILITIESNESSINKIRRKFWHEIYNDNYNENTAERVCLELKKEEINYSAINIRYKINFGLLNISHSKVIYNLFIPFLFRNNKINKKIKNTIAEYFYIHHNINDFYGLSKFIIANKETK